MATDGGYWMIGLGALSALRAAELFAGAPISASNSGLHQLHRLHRSGCAVQLLPMARDLDTIDDLRSIAAARRPGRLGELASKIVDGLRVVG